MTAEAAHHQLVSVEDYLAGELTSEIKHEYLGGIVYAMAGASNRHEVICTNLLGILFGKLEMPSIWSQHQGPYSPAG